MSGFRMLLKRLIDFIKSWLYYPKMKRYLNKLGIHNWDNQRLYYAWWHCRVGKLKEKKDYGAVYESAGRGLEWDSRYKDIPRQNSLDCMSFLPKKAIKILPETKIHNMPYKCRGSNCRKEFIVNVGG